MIIRQQRYGYGDAFKTELQPSTTLSPVKTKQTRVSKYSSEKKKKVIKVKTEAKDTASISGFGVECNEEFGEDNPHVLNQVDNESASDTEDKAKVVEEEPLQNRRAKYVNSKGLTIFNLYSSQNFMVIFYFLL